MRTDWQSPHEIPPVRVLRLTLRGPVTLGHILLLDELGSPVVRGEGIGIGDLYTAALVCSSTVSDARGFLKSRWLPILTRFHGYRCGRLNFDDETGKFCDWFREQCGGPTIDRAETEVPKDNRSTVPWYWSKMAVAVGHLGISVPDAEKMPVKRLNQLIGAYAETQGNVKFVTDEVDKANEVIAKAEKAWLERLEREEA